MKKLLLSLLFIGSLTSNAQVTVFEDSFESYTNFAITGFGDWQTIDGDLLTTYTGGLPTGITPSWPNAGAAMAYQIFNPSATTPQAVSNSTDACNTGTGAENRNFDPKTGSKYAACWASALTGGSPVNNDWLISPVITLGTSNNELRFWVKSLSDCYGLEKYRVGVYVGTGTPTAANFTFISGIPSLTAPNLTWEEKIFSLNAYSNQSIRIGIRCVSPDAYMFMVDDFKITSSNLKVDEFFSSKFSTYPNPANNSVTVSNNDNILLSNVVITDINGRNVKEVKVNNVSETEINISDLTSGIYFMNIDTDNGKAVKKIIKN
jgi:hypothetical protein